MGFAGKGRKQQQWLTYRDQETYRNIVLQGAAVSAQLADDPGRRLLAARQRRRSDIQLGGLQGRRARVFRQRHRLAGTLHPARQAHDEDWKVLAEAAKWSRANADVLVDTHWIGGDPARSSRSTATPPGRRARASSCCAIRTTSRTSSRSMSGRPSNCPRGHRAASRWSVPGPRTRRNRRVRAEAGRPLRLTLKPFETVILETVKAP